MIEWESDKARQLSRLRQGDIAKHLRADRVECMARVLMQFQSMPHAAASKLAIRLLDDEIKKDERGQAWQD